MTPTVALTFDDGPGAHTLEILALLTDHQMRATFFVIGEHVKGNESILQALVAAGNEIGLHGWNHTLVSHLTRTELRGQISLCKQAVHVACGVTPRWWRSPWGKTPDAAKDVILGANLRIAPLGLDVFDCERSAGKIVDLIAAGIGEESIVCLHDGVAPNGNERVKSRHETVRAMREIVDLCRSVTLTELMG